MIQPPHMATLKRALGRWDLTAIGVNQVIGGAIFLVPSQVAAQIGALEPDRVRADGHRDRSPWRCASPKSAAGSTAPADRTSTRARRSAASSRFEVGWMQWFTRAASQASVMAGIAVALGYYWPAVTVGWPRAAVLIGITSALAWVNVRGIRQSAWVVNALTIGKLLPLALFIAVGLFYIEPARLTDVAADLPEPGIDRRAAADLHLRRLRRRRHAGGRGARPAPDVPFALVTTILAVMTIMTLAQIVAQGVLPDLAPHATPIADAAAVFLGSAGRAARRRRLGGLDDRQQRRPGAERIAHAVRAGRARRAAGVLCAAFTRASGRRRTP